MQVAHYNQHRHQALTLYHKRAELLREKIILADELALYEYRLHIHLYMLAQQSLAPASKLNTPDDVFIFLVTDIIQHGTAHQSVINKYLPQSEFSPAVEAALTLYPPADDGEFLLNLYYTATELRPQLLKLWLAISQKVPSSVLQQALKSSEPTLRLAAIQCTANLPNHTLTQLQPFYQDSDIDCALAAWYAGYLRRDPNVINMIRETDSACFTPEQHQQLMHLCALIGESEFLPCLRTYAQQHPEPGYDYLALYGYPSVQQDLLTGMNNIKTLQAAAQAWFLLTGYRIAMQPRLSVVGTEQQSPQTIPNVDDAIAWWENNGQQWNESERYCMGKRVNEENIKALRTEYAGQWMQESSLNMM